MQPHENPGLDNPLERRKCMNLINFIVWLSTGAVIGWFASRMVQVEHRRAHKILPGEADGSKKS